MDVPTVAPEGVSAGSLALGATGERPTLEGLPGHRPLSGQLDNSGSRAGNSLRSCKPPRTRGSGFSLFLSHSDVVLVSQSSTCRRRKVAVSHGLREVVPLLGICPYEKAHPVSTVPILLGGA